MTSSGAPSYFVDHKRGEVNELKALLRNQRVERDAVKKREVIKKVIAYMTLGIDVSKIFSEMVMAASTKDLVQKKMVYHYLCTYAHQKANLALMAINTLQKDCQDEDPMVRGLALRSLTSLRLPNIVEYSMLCMRKGLNDPSPYVRKTAVAGVAKIYRLFPQQIKESDLVDLLYNMIKDKDTSVIQNALCALNEILASEGKMAINQAIILYILNRLREFNEWGQCYVLELVARYTPANQNEMFDIMNLLEDRLKHSNSAVVLATTKVFLHFTQANPKLHQEVIKRLKAPLLTLMGGGSVELAYVVLSHIRLLVARAPGVFDSEYKEFFCRFNDPVPVKTEKLSILTLLANDKNFSDVINELSEYVTDTDAPIARASIKGIARIAIKIETAADEAIEHLLSFLDLNLDYTTAETCVMLKDLLRKYPERYEDVLPALQKCLKRGGIEEADGKAAVVWMIGEYGHDISDAPYILEPLIDAFAEEPSPAVRHELLTSAMKLFFKRLPEMKKMLGKLLNAAIADVGKVDVRDRALMYYRLLRMDVHEAARVVNCPKVIVDAFAESEDKELKEKIFAEFNTLSVVYGLPSERFVDEKKNKDPGITLGEDYDKPYEEDKDDGTNGTKPDKKKEAEDEDDKEGITSANPAASVPTTPVVPKMAEKKHETPKKEVDLLSMGDLLDFGGPATTPASPGPAGLSLKPASKIDPKTFQQKWMGKAKEDGFAEVTLRMTQLASSAGGTGAVLAKYVSTLCEGKQLATMAQGVQGNVMKLYLYANDDTGLYLLEFVLDLSSGKGRASIKCDNPSPAAPGLIGAVLRDALKSFL